MNKTLRFHKSFFTLFLLTPFVRVLKSILPVFILTIISTSVSGQTSHPARQKKPTQASNNDLPVVRLRMDSISALKKSAVSGKSRQVKTLEKGKTNAAGATRPRSVND